MTTVYGKVLMKQVLSTMKSQKQSEDTEKTYWQVLEQYGNCLFLYFFVEELQKETQYHRSVRSLSSTTYCQVCLIIHNASKDFVKSIVFLDYNVFVTLDQDFRATFPVIVDMLIKNESIPDNLKNDFFLLVNSIVELLRKNNPWVIGKFLNLLKKEISILVLFTVCLIDSLRKLHFS